jgi:asparagine synthase (glutamine-hydrolysing)
MCGLSGFWQPYGKTWEDLSAQAWAMANTLVHRGPDDGGVWVDPEVGLGFGFRRLAIVDLSAEGHQPMHSAGGRYVIAFNGEVYNFSSLREQLETLSHRFRGHSDTEVMLAAIEEWGLEAAVKQFVGMFAFALWDRRDRCLSLVRDRLGIKPLYYGWMGQTFVFGSETKALRVHPEFRPEVDRGVLALYLRYGYVPAPYSIYRSLHQLPPGCILTLTEHSGRPSPVPYWSMREVAERGVADPFTGSEADALDQLDSVLREAVRLRMVADVPLGAFLSGGIDSSTVVALMQAQSAQPVKTFSIGFHEAGYNEATHAKMVANHLGTDHTELYVTPAEAQAVIPRLPEIYDEPFSDSSQIPTFLVSQLTRSRVTVSLSGDGGDELFVGYPRYFLTNAIWQKIGWLPPQFRRGLARGIASVDGSVYDRFLGRLTPYAGRYGSEGRIGDKLHKLADVLDQATQEDLYCRMISQWRDPTSVVLGSHEPRSVLTDPNRWLMLPDMTPRMAYLDTITYLPDDILTKVDRASMAVSLEARVPFLDHRVVEFVWRLPTSLKVRNGEGKWILRQLLYRYVPQELIDRPKMGFGVPIDSWLRGPLRDWAEALLDEQRLRDEGFLDPAPVRTQWREHLSGQRSWHSSLWAVLMFQAWLQCQDDRSGSVRAESGVVS